MESNGAAAAGCEFRSLDRPLEAVVAVEAVVGAVDLLVYHPCGFFTPACLIRNSRRLAS